MEKERTFGCYLDSIFCFCTFLDGGTYLNIIKIIISIIAMFSIIKIPELYMEFSISQWEPMYQIEMDRLYKDYMSEREKHFESAEKSFADSTNITDEKTAELKKIHDFIYATLDRQQNEGECEEKKLLRCSNINVSGFGAMAHRWVICLHIAFALGRSYIIDQNEYKFNGLTNFTDVGKCGHYVNSKWRSIKNKCNFNDYNCYIDKDGNHINNTYKLLEFTHQNIFPATKYIPGTIPRGIEKRLVQLGVENPWHWFTSQLLGYMILRPNKQFEAKFLAGIKKGGLRRPMIGIHYRGGDALQEGRILSLKLYLDLIQQIVDKSQNSSTKFDNTRNIYFATDDTRVLRKMNELTKTSKYSFHVETTPLGFELRSGRGRADTVAKTMEMILVDLYFLVRCDYAIVPFTSNIGRLLWELKTSQFPYDMRGKVIAVSGKMHYNWNNYDPKHVYYLAIKDNPTSLEIEKNKIIKYKKGDFARGMERRRKRVIINGTEVEIASVAGYSNFNHMYGYVFTRDFVEWPGDVNYVNDM